MMNRTKEIELLRSVEQQYIDCGDTEIVEAIERAIESIKGNAESIIKILEPCEESFLQETYRQNCIDYVKRTMECVGYRDYIVEKLEQEPCKFGEKIRSCEDAISRREVINAINQNCIWENEYNLTSSRIKKAVENLPSIQPKQNRWIPVSERLPEESITVLGTTEFDDLYKAELYDDCGEKKWYADGDFDVPIVAWMPLPKPYNAEMESEKMNEESKDQNEVEE